MGVEFCPELQGNWHLESIRLVELGEIKVVVKEIMVHDTPSPLGRHGSDVLSYPSIYAESNVTEFVFLDCVYFNVRDDLAPAYAENDAGEGRTFQRLLKSELVELHASNEIRKVVHYRLACRNEVIDVVCHKPPMITRKAACPRCEQ